MSNHVEPNETVETSQKEGPAQERTERYIPSDRDREIYRQLFLLRRDPGGIAKRFGLSETTIRNVARLTRNALAERQFELSSIGEVEQLAEELLEVGASLDEAMQGWEKSQAPKVTKQITQRTKDENDLVKRVTEVEQCGQPRFLMAASKLRAERRAVRQLIRETKEREKREADPEAAAKKAALERLTYEREKNAEKKAEEQRRDDKIMEQIKAMSFSSTPEFQMLMRAAHEEDARRARRIEKREAAKAGEPRASATGGTCEAAATATSTTPATPVTPVAPTAPPAGAPSPPVANAQGSRPVANEHYSSASCGEIGRKKPAFQSL